MPAVVAVDVEKAMTDWLFATFPTLSGMSGWKCGTRVESGVTPTQFVAVRAVGGSADNILAMRWRVDFRVWGDGTLAGEGARFRAARTLLAVLQRDFRAVVFAAPVNLPDPADDTKTLTLFTVEVLLRGQQI